jgi:hypothetical protein
MQSANNELSLFLTFHCRPENDHTVNHQVTRVVTIPIIIRMPASEIDMGAINDNVDTDD